MASTLLAAPRFCVPITTARVALMPGPLMRAKRAGPPDLAPLRLTAAAAATAWAPCAIASGSQ